MNFFFWRRQKVLTRGDDRIVVNYNLFTGRWSTAGLFHCGELVEVTCDPKTLQGWMVTGFMNGILPHN